MAGAGLAFRSRSRLSGFKDIPKEALDAGEGYNLWRQFIHILPDGRAALFYNSGYYGREQLYLKVSDKP